MLLLAVDTSTPSGSLAVLREGVLAGVISTSSEEPYSSRLFRELDVLLADQHLEIPQFDVYAVTAGPGSFTGLRVGLAAVKAWAEVFGKPIAAVSGLEAVAAQADAQDGWIAAAMDARRGQIYAALFRREGSLLVREGDEEVCAADAFLASLPRRTADRPVQFVSPSPEILDPALARADFLPPGSARTCRAASNVLAPVIASLAWERARRGELTDALHLDANYIRCSDAELLWKRP